MRNSAKIKLSNFKNKVSPGLVSVHNLSIKFKLPLLALLSLCFFAKASRHQMNEPRNNLSQEVVTSLASSLRKPSSQRSVAKALVSRHTSAKKESEMKASLLMCILPSALAFSTNGACHQRQSKTQLFAKDQTSDVVVDSSKRSMLFNAGAVAAALGVGTMFPNYAAAKQPDCMQDCLKNCKKIAPQVCNHA